jgi:hypothetical protein
MCVIVLIIFIYKNRVSKGKFGKALWILIFWLILIKIWMK